MKKKLESELINIAKRILTMEGSGDLNALQTEARLVYEHLTLLKFVEGQFGEFMEMSKPKSEVADRFEVLANAVLKGNSDVPESNPHENEESIMTPVMDTIKDLVMEMPEQPEDELGETLDDILADFAPEANFVKRDSEIVTPDIKVKRSHRIVGQPVSLNDKLKSGLHIGLNDKLAFIKHLFEGSNEDYLRVISQVSTMETYEEASYFIVNMVKPDHDNWEGKEEYEARLLHIVKSRFS